MAPNESSGCHAQASREQLCHGHYHLLGRACSPPRPTRHQLPAPRTWGILLPQEGPPNARVLRSQYHRRCCRTLQALRGIAQTVLPLPTKTTVTKPISDGLMQHLLSQPSTARRKAPAASRLAAGPYEPVIRELRKEYDVRIRSEEHTSE